MPKQSPFRTIIYVRLDAFFTAVEEALNPSLRQHPVVVVGDPKTRNLVACPNYHARQLGIRKNMPLPDAYRLAPQAKYLAGSFAHYRQFSEEFFRILSRFTSQIEPVSLDQAYLDVTDAQSQWISPEQLAQEIKKVIFQELEITVSVGIAANKVCAKVASECQKPDALVYVPYGREKEFLAPMPVGSLPGIGSRTEKALNAMGIFLIGQLANQPFQNMIRSFGPNGFCLWQLANALDARVVVVPGQKKSVSRSQTFEFSTSDLNLLKLSYFNLAKKVCGSLKTEKKLCRTISLKMSNDGLTWKSRQYTLPRVTNDSYKCLEIISRIIDENPQELKKIRSVGLCVLNLENENLQANLFEQSFDKIKKIRQSLMKVKNQFNFSYSFKQKLVTF
ncbi:MAG: DNA polymerase IV [Patescibacteria group bacterium]|jgi:nucleotidyltransferase/DNA polymerase involved in DNA repair